MAWDDDIKGKYISTKVGTDITMKITDIVKVTDKPKFDPKFKDGNPQGFHFEFHSLDGIVTVGSFGLQKALSDAQVDIGDTITIKHPENNEYIVKKVENPF